MVLFLVSTSSQLIPKASKELKMLDCFILKVPRPSLAVEEVGCLQFPCPHEAENYFMECEWSGFVF